ncbi:SDR family oxidoreductase, partial [Fusobacterium nucleatum]
MNKTVMVVGATGSIGRYVVEVLLEKKYNIKALVRNPEKANFSKEVELVVGEITKPETLNGISENVDYIIFTHGSLLQNEDDAKNIDYGAVPNILKQFKDKKVRVALMTSIYVTKIPTTNNTIENDELRKHRNAVEQAALWKRRAERILRASGHDYTIVRPSWFDHNKEDELKLYFLQGDKRQQGTPADGAVSRRQIAETLVNSLELESAKNKTIELFAEKGEKTTDFDSLFKNVLADNTTKNLDSSQDTDNLPLENEPEILLNDL